MQLKLQSNQPEMCTYMSLIGQCSSLSDDIMFHCDKKLATSFSADVSLKTTNDCDTRQLPSLVKTMIYNPERLIFLIDTCF